MAQRYTPEKITTKKGREIYIGRVRCLVAGRTIAELERNNDTEDRHREDIVSYTIPYTQCGLVTYSGVPHIGLHVVSRYGNPEAHDEELK